MTNETTPGTADQTALAREAGETATVARKQIERNRDAFTELGERLRRNPPRFVTTCARGSSNHASTYGKYLIETHAGRAVAPIGPSIASVYHAPLDLRESLFIAVSQSGRSPDLLKLTETAKSGGAYTVAFVNDEASPLIEMCDFAIPLSAGPETSVAATKSYILSGLAYLQLIAYWQQSEELLQAALELPRFLEEARTLDWSSHLETLQKAVNLYVVSRGIGLGIGSEIALKLKEVCGIHAEAFGSAEVIHGPLALVGPDFPVILLGQNDKTEASVTETGKRFIGLGAKVLSTVKLDGADILPTVTAPGIIAPLCQLQSFYMAVSGLARARGFDPDKPPHLRKVTETI